MEIQEFIIEYLKNFFESFGTSAEFEVSETEEIVKVAIKGEDLNMLIGYHGEALASLQQLLSLAVNAHVGVWKNIVVDINGYRDRRKEKIEEITKNYIDKVRFSNEPVHMPAMKSYERKYVHEFLSTYDDISSESEGEGFERHIVLKPGN